MFQTFARSWEYAKISYALTWQNKSLLIFPLVSGIAALLVLASFAVPLHQTGTLQAWAETASQSEAEKIPVAAWITLFAYYVANYFVIVFFNSALISCAMRAMQGQPVAVGEGLSMAAKRWHAILCWAVVSAIVGIILRALESNKKIGRIIVSLLGTAWTAMTFFVVPVIVIEGRGPFAAIGESLSTLKDNWGTALIGNFSLGFINFLILIPVFLVSGALVFFGIRTEVLFLTIVSMATAAVLILFFTLLSAAASTVFKAVLFSYATGKELPDQINSCDLSQAFLQDRD